MKLQRTQSAYPPGGQSRQSTRPPVGSVLPRAQVRLRGAPSEALWAAPALDAEWLPPSDLASAEAAARPAEALEGGAYHGEALASAGLDGLRALAARRGYDAQLDDVRAERERIGRLLDVRG